MDTLKRRHFLKLGGIAGLTALSGCQDGIGGQAKTPSEGNADDLGLAISSSGPGCLHQWDDTHSGWVHTVAHGETYDMTFDVRISHSPGKKVNVNLTTTPLSSEYVLEFTIEDQTEESTERKQPISDSDCDIGARLQGGGSIPSDFKMLRVTVNDKTLKIIERNGTFAALHPLPDPIRT